MSLTSHVLRKILQSLSYKIPSKFWKWNLSVLMHPLPTGSGGSLLPKSPQWPFIRSLFIRIHPSFPTNCLYIAQDCCQSQLILMSLILVNPVNNLVPKIASSSNSKQCAGAKNSFKTSRKKILRIKSLRNIWIIATVKDKIFSIFKAIEVGASRKSKQQIW